MTDRTTTYVRAEKACVRMYVSIEDRPAAAFKAGGGRFSFAACFLYRWECFYRISR